MQAKIRAATNKDLNSFYEFFLKSINDYFSYYTENSKKYLLNKKFNKENIEKALRDGFGLIAIDRHEIIGILLAKTMPSAGVWELNWLIVDEKHRNNGIGSELINHWEAKATSMGVHCLRLQTSNEDTLRFYKNRGFIHYGLIPKGTYGLRKYFFYKLIQEPKEENYLKY